MELKYVENKRNLVLIGGSNRTFMELKLRQ